MNDPSVPVPSHLPALKQGGTISHYSLNCVDPSDLVVASHLVDDFYARLLSVHESETDNGRCGEGASTVNPNRRRKLFCFPD